MARRLGAFFKPFKRTSVSPTQPVGVAGTSIFGGFVTENETKDALRGQKKYQTYSEILANTSIAAAGVRYFLNLVSKAEWKVEPPEDSPNTARAEEIAEIIQNSLDEMETPWHRVIRRAAMYRFYGFSIQEWTAKVDDEGNVIYDDIAPRAQITIERWDTDEAGKVFGVVQRAPQDYREIYIPRAKVIYMVDDTLNDSPIGLGLLRHIAEPARRLQRFEQLEGYGFEGDLRGIPVGRAPFALLQEMVTNGKLSVTDKEAIEKPLRDFIQSHIKSPALGMLLDSITYQSQDDAATPSDVPQWNLELLKAGNTSQEAVSNTIQRINREIARTLGVEQLLLGEAGSGSFALSRDKTQAFAAIVDSTLQELAETFNKDYLNPLFELNGWDEKLKPTLRTKSVPLRDILQITQALKDLAAAGAPLSPEDPAINEARALIGLSKAEPVDLEALVEQMAGFGDEPGKPGKPAQSGRPDAEPERTDGNDDKAK